MSLSVENLNFSYPRGGKLFVDFHVRFDAGRTVLLGPNGAGKSTLLAILAGAIEPSVGAIHLDGCGSPRRQRKAYRRSVAWLPQQVRAFPGLSAREQVAYVGWLKGLSRRESWDRSLSALEQVDLLSSAATPAKSLSGGQLERLGIAGAFVHDADVILLDEGCVPVSGVVSRS